MPTKENSKPIYIAIDLIIEEDEDLVKLFKEFKDVFPWLYKDSKGFDPQVC